MLDVSAALRAAWAVSRAFFEAYVQDTFTWWCATFTVIITGSWSVPCLNAMHGKNWWTSNWPRKRPNKCHVDGAAEVTEDIRGSKRGPVDAHGGTKQGPKNEKQANMGPTRIQKGVKKGSKWEVLKKLKIEALACTRAQFSAWRDTPNGASKLGRSREAQKWGPRSAQKPQMSAR